MDLVFKRGEQTKGLLDMLTDTATIVRNDALAYLAGAREALRKRGEKDLGKAGRAIEAALATSREPPAGVSMPTPAT